ncbi:ABC transporter permease [Pseudoduganella buxea]|uniref:ABC transporter permease n=1 Tax=Pseudoduganella buxea TaxID=1949069 RepID=A0A6I3T0Q1_9BURK|nr:ABC transporter permease [Pseudoduganella buxea]MTV54406.1 ABC transporter permease [Pseudoduganella buxea]GGC10883.1 hypothetical protein GCM10011572_35260 [Pseudoduganella buxea]
MPRWGTLRAVRAIAAATVLEAWRSQLPWLLAGLAAVAAALAVFLHGVALVEAGPTRLALLAALLRLATAGIVATLAVAGTVREAQDKQAEQLLTLPIARAAWLCGRLAGFGAVALLPALLALAILLPATTSLWPALLWAATLLCELWIVAAFATFCALGLGNVAPALCATFGFYALARSLTALQLLGDTTARDAGTRLLALATDVVAWLLPRLDGFARTEWLLYGTGTPSDLGAVLVQTVLALLLLLAASLFDLYRRQF